MSNRLGEIENGFPNCFGAARRPRLLFAQANPDERNGLAAGVGGDEAAAQAMTSFVAVRRRALLQA